MCYFPICPPATSSFPLIPTDVKKKKVQITRMID